MPSRFRSETWSSRSLPAGFRNTRKPSAASRTFSTLRACFTNWMPRVPIPRIMKTSFESTRNRSSGKFKEMSDAGGGELGLRTPFAKGGFEIAALSAGLAKAALFAVLDGRASNAYALSSSAGASLPSGQAERLLPAQQHRHSSSCRPCRKQGRSRGGAGLGRASRKRHGGDLHRGSGHSHHLAASGTQLSSRYRRTGSTGRRCRRRSQHQCAAAARCGPCHLFGGGRAHRSART